MSAGYLALAGFQAYAGMQQAELIRNNAKLTRQVGEMNADAAEVDAYRAEMEGYSQAARYQTVIDQTISEQRVAFESQNVDSTFGTAAEVVAETKLTGFLNQLEIKKAAHAKAMGFKDQARNYRLGGVMGDLQARMNASAAQSAGLMNAGSTVIAGYTRK